MAYDDIQDQIDQGRQQAADELGPPHNVYRLNSMDGQGRILIPANKVATVNVYTKIASGTQLKPALETEKFQGIIWYDVTADMSPFKVGDVFVLNDPVYGQGAAAVNFPTMEFKGFALADHSPIKKAIAGRLNCTVKILRASAQPNASGQWDKTSDDAKPLILSAGTFSWGNVGAVAAQIPAGLVALRSAGDRAFTNVPGEQRKSNWAIYLPALKGFKVREGDKVIGPDGARYIVLVPYSQEVGATGNQWLLEREAGNG